MQLQKARHAVTLAAALALTACEGKSVSEAEFHRQRGERIKAEQLLAVRDADRNETGACFSTYFGSMRLDLSYPTPQGLPPDTRTVCAYKGSLEETKVTFGLAVGRESKAALFFAGRQIQSAEPVYSVHEIASGDFELRQFLLTNLNIGKPPYSWPDATVEYRSGGARKLKVFRKDGERYRQAADVSGDEICVSGLGIYTPVKEDEIISIRYNPLRVAVFSWNGEAGRYTGETFDAWFQRHLAVYSRDRYTFYQKIFGMNPEEFEMQLYAGASPESLFIGNRSCPRPIGIR